MPGNPCRQCSDGVHVWQDLRAASKGGIDPNGMGASAVATDVIWSDPVAEPGLRTNDSRGVGLIFGPEITQVLPWHTIAPCSLTSSSVIAFREAFAGW